MDEGFKHQNVRVNLLSVMVNISSTALQIALKILGGWISTAPIVGKYN